LVPREVESAPGVVKLAESSGWVLFERSIV
jgi:hypothetical protein